MTETIAADGLTRPSGYEDAPMPRRNAPRSLLPSTWINRELTVEYRDANDTAQTTTGALLDFCPFGVILNVSGARTALSWDRLTVVELKND